MDLLPVDDAVKQLLETARPATGDERTLLDQSYGRASAEDVFAQIDVPFFDNSAMDGFAGCHGDLLEGMSYSVCDRIPAGRLGQTLTKNSLARIFTGAPIPEGADTVIVQEDVEFSLDTATIKKLPKKYSNVRRRGHDISSGSKVVSKGEFLSSAAVALLASVGETSVKVKIPLTVAIFSTGDELVLPGKALKSAQSYNSNRFLIYGLLRDMGLNVIDLGIVPDDYSKTLAMLSKAGEVADVIISSGGVSVGEEDHVKAAVRALGSVNIWKVAMKPGKPFLLGEINGKPLLGLPGNPVSTFVSFFVFAKPFLKATQGLREVAPNELYGLSSFDFQAGSRREYLRARLRSKQGETWLEKYAHQGSSVLSSLRWANCLAIVDGAQQIKIGDPIKFIELD